MTTFPNVTFSSIISSNNSYFGPLYIRTKAVETYYSYPRFGNNGEIAWLASDNQEEKASYKSGIVALSVILYLFFLLWAALIVTFKYKEPPKYGFLSGSNFIEPRVPTLHELRRPRRVRMAFMVSAFMIFLFSILFMTKGVSNAYNTVSTAYESTQSASFTLQESNEIINGLVEVGKETASVQDVLDVNQSALCPGANITELMGNDINPQKLAGELDELSNLILDNAQSMKANLADIEGTVESAEDVLVSYDEWIWYPLIVIIPHVLISAIFVVGVLLAWMNVSSEKFQWFLTWVALPFFVTLTIVYCFFAGAFGILAIVNADACTGGESVSPEGTIEAVMAERNMHSDSLWYKVIVYVIEGCHNENPLEFIDQYQTELEDAINQLTQFSEIANSIDLNDLCQKDVSPLITDIASLKGSLLELYQLILSTLSLYSCKRLNELYVNTVHDATCTYSASAMGWVYTSLVIISIFSLLMITLRASWRDVLHEDFLELKEEIAERVAATTVPVSDEFNDESVPRSNAVFSGVSEDQSSKIDSASNTPIISVPSVEQPSNIDNTSNSVEQPLEDISQSSTVPTACLSDEGHEGPLEIDGAFSSPIKSAHSEDQFLKEIPSPSLENHNNREIPQSTPVLNARLSEEQTSKTDSASNNPIASAPAEEQSSKEAPSLNLECGSNSKDTSQTTRMLTTGLSEEQTSKNDSTSNNPIAFVHSEEQPCNEPALPNVTQIALSGNGTRSVSGKFCIRSVSGKF